MKGLLPLFALAAIAPAQEIVITKQTSDAKRGETAYFKNSEVTFSGRVTGKLKSDGTARAVPVRLLVKSTSGGTATVDLGPNWFLRDQRTSINVGDRITVTGSKVRYNGQSVINARQVQKGRAKLVLRDGSGFPYWVARRQQAPVEPASGGVSGRIARMQTININGQVFNGAYVTLPDGREQLLAFAPDWYYNQQGIALTPGNFVRAYGGSFVTGPGVTSPAPGLFIVGGLYTPNGYFGFTNPNGYVYGNFPGFPVFPGF